MMALRRQVLVGAGLAGTALLSPCFGAWAEDFKGFPHDGHAPAPSVRIAEPAVGTAGAVWRPLIESMPASMVAGLGLSWAAGGPGFSQFELVSHRVDVARFGPLGVASARGHVGDLVMFGPALYSHARWLVPTASPFRHPKDLVGRRVACPMEISESFQQASLAAATVGLDIKRTMLPVFGPLPANQAAFERQDVEAILALEPTASRLVAKGAREIASVAGMWQEGTGDTQPLFLVGVAAQRVWVEADPARAKRVAQLIVDANSVIRGNPAQLQIPALSGLYAIEWDDGMFRSIQRQIDAALRVGLLRARPDQALYVRL